MFKSEVHQLDVNYILNIDKEKTVKITKFLKRFYPNHSEEPRRKREKA